jgi:hypothetical protein
MSDQAISRPRSGRLKHARAYSGLGRSALYVLAAEHEGLFKKNGAATIVDFDILDRIIDDLPPAKINPPKPKPKAKRKTLAAEAAQSP